MYRLSLNGPHVYFSDLVDVLGNLEVALNVDWGYIAARVMRPIWQTEATGICGIEELPGGHCDEIASGKRASRVYWSPAVFARNQRDDIEECVRGLRSTVQRCVDAWSSCHSTILHQLSGGLDSSIVLGCLSEAPSKPELTCITHYGRHAGTDERPFARAAVESVKCRHVEVPLEEKVRLESWESVPVTPRPGSYLPVAQERQVIELARELGATAISSGDGGDAAFCQLADVRIAADYVRDHGIDTRLMEVIRSTAMLTETSIPTVARAALRGLSRQTRVETLLFAEGLKHRKLASAATIEAVTSQLKRYAPVFTEGTGDLPEAKAIHVQMLSQPFVARSSFANDNDPERIDPLAAELVKEYCLQIPTYILCREGRARWAARSAFHGCVPPSLLQRTTKGSPKLHIDQLAEDHWLTISERLLNGQLMRQGIVDAERLGGALKRRTMGVTSGELLDAYGLEVWVAGIERLKQQPRDAWNKTVFAVT